MLENNLKKFRTRFLMFYSRKMVNIRLTKLGTARNHCWAHSGTGKYVKIHQEVAKNYPHLGNLASCSEDHVCPQ